MSDCFDHAWDAYESRERAELWGEGEPSNSYYSRSRPIGNTKISYDQKVAETPKAFLLYVKDIGKFWVPKSLCKNHNPAKKIISIWNGFKIKTISE